VSEIKWVKNEPHGYAMLSSANEFAPTG